MGYLYFFNIFIFRDFCTCLLIIYFFDNSTYKKDISKTALIYEINANLNVMSKTNLKKVLSFIDIIDG